MSQYTDLIDNGKITNAKDFLTLCLREFGVAFELRDMRLSIESIYNLRNSLNVIDYTYQSRKMSECYEELKKLRKQIEDADERAKAYEEYVSEVNNTLEYYLGAKAENQAKKQKYQKFINQIESWECSPDFTNIKQFAIDQLKLPTDDGDFYAEEIERCYNKLKNPEKSFETYVKTEYEVLNDSIDSYAMSIVRIYDQNRKKKEFLDKFINEINNIGNK